MSKIKVVATRFGKGRAYKITEPTYAIWIQNSCMYDSKIGYKAAKDLAIPKHERLLHTAIYFFDTGTPPRDKYPIPKFEHLTEETAKNIIQEFYPFKDKIETLLVYGGEGMRRAPAVAIALNELYQLGRSSNYLKYKKHREFDREAYQMLMAVGPETISHSQQDEKSLFELLKDCLFG